MSQNDSLNSRRTCSESSVQSNISEDTDRNDQNNSNNPENIGSTESKKLESKESLPNRILVNAFNVKESGKPEANSDNTPTKKKSHSNIKNMLEDIDELQIFKYLAPYDMQVFEKKYLSQFHCKKENLLKADNVESKTESESESTTDSDDEDDDSDVDFITTYSSNNPKMLRNSLKAVVNSQVKLQCVPLLVSEMWESEAIEEIVQKLNVVLTRYSREAFTQDKFVEMLKDEFVVAKVNSGDLVVCSKENVMGKELHKLLKAAEEETEREILVSVYCVLLEKSNKARKLEYLVKKMKSEIETLDIDGTGLYEKLANLMKKQGLFVIKSSPEGKESVKIKPELYSKIKETTDRAMKKKETVREMKSQEKSEEKHNSKLSVHQRTQIREMVYDQLVATENVPIPFKNILGIGTIYEVFFSKGAAEKMNIIKEFTKIFTATKKLPDWFEVNDETVCLHSSVYEAYVHRNEDEELLESSSRSVVLSEQLQNSEENEVEDSWDHSYAFVSDDVIDLCLTVVNQDIVSKALDLAEKKNSVVRQHSDLQMGKVSSSCEKYLVYERDMIITTNSSNNQNERRTETIQDNTMNTNKLQLGSHFTNMLPSVEKMQSSCKDLQLCNRDNEFTVNHSDSSASTKVCSQKCHTFSDEKCLQENVSPSGEKNLPKCTAIDDVRPTYHLDQCDHDQELETNSDCLTNVKETSCMSINKEEALNICILKLFQACKCQKMPILNLLLNDNVQKMWQAVKKSGTVKKFTQYVSKNANLDIEIGEDGKIWIKCCSGSDSEFRENITEEKETEHPTSKCKDRVCNEDTSTYSCESTVSNNTPYGLSLTTAEKILVQNILDLFCVKNTSQLTRKDLCISKIQDSWIKVYKEGKYRKLWDFVKCQTEYFSASKFMGKSTIIKVPEIHVLQHSHLQSNETLTASMESHLQSIQTLTASKDSHLQSNETLTPSMDSHLQSNETLTPRMDSHQQSNETLTASMDSHLQYNETLTPHYAQEESIENSINHFQRIRSAVDEFCASRKLNQVETVISKIESTFKCSAILGGKCIADGSGSTAEEAAIASLCNALTWLQDMFC